MRTAIVLIISENEEINVELPVETELRSTFDEVSGCKYSVDHKPYMQMIDHETGEVYLLENSVFRREYAKGRRLNPGEIVTFQDVPVIGVYETREINDLDIWGNANYLKFIRKKAGIFNGRIEYLKDELAELEDAGVYETREINDLDIWGNANYLKFIRKKAGIFNGRIEYLKDELAELEDAKRDFAYHVFEYVKEQCGNADAMFKQNLIAMVGIPGFIYLKKLDILNWRQMSTEMICIRSSKNWKLNKRKRVILWQEKWDGKQRSLIL